ncbi:MAG: hypothetical protein NTV52_24370, partial [Acidobacteria bacterium]|nr:hypothetical protein [Acidobacteriota bacterium]
MTPAQGDDACEIHPGLRLGANNVEISALIAPKPLLLVSSTKHWTKHIPVLELPLAEAVYQLYGATSSIQNAHVDAKHNYNRESREAVYRFPTSTFAPMNPCARDAGGTRPHRLRSASAPVRRAA